MVNRVVVCIAGQSNVIEASPDMRRDSEKEWYYGNADKERLGPYSFDEVSFNVICTFILTFCVLFLCFDAVGWAAGRASGL